MGAGGWNKGKSGAPGGGMSGKKHSEKTIKNFKDRKHTPESIKRLKERPKECYKKPQAIEIDGVENCNYGCGQLAKFKFSNGKLCCSTSYNSCPKKRKTFSERNDHSENAIKSLTTRIELGITKSSRKKAHATMEANGTYQVMREKMQLHWKNNPHQNNVRCPLIPYKDTSLNYQGSYEYEFLEKLEQQYGIPWIISNVKRGPSIWYNDPKDNTKRLYISDFLIDNTIYEIKSQWTWNRHGTNEILENMNKEKLNECIKQGYKVILVLNKQEQEWL
jgi:hypothetical protein